MRKCGAQSGRPIRHMAKIGRNEPCPCGSGLKYKKCHASPGGPPAGKAFALPNLQHVLEQMRAGERIRQTQQGLGRPIVALKSGDRQIVAVGNKVYFSDKWKTFPDFLADYMKQKLGSYWGNAEIAKPLAERHPVMQWYDAYCKYQQATIKTPGEVSNANVTGIVACYLGLAYSLYLLDHNVEIQERLIGRLKDPANFQGAFYELFVANVLIRAGFQLTLEDESDGKSKHCEFAAVSRETGKKYWVEAKMGSAAGVLGKTHLDGGSGRKVLGRLIPNLNNALGKPAADERLIFIDLNVEPKFDRDNKPTWGDAAVKRIERYEASELPKGASAYLFVTNIGFHRNLDGTPAPAMLPFGLGIADFNRPGYMRLSEIYRQKRKHIDAHHIGESFLNYTKFPTTFDGSLPSEAFGAATSRVKIGESYLFRNVGGADMVGTVTYATVWESEKKAAISVTFTDGTASILTQPMTDAEFSDYKAHPEAYFGKILPVGKKVENQYELFEFFVEANKGLSRATLLQCLGRPADFDPLGVVSDADLLGEYCEALVGAVPDPAKKSA
jgi:SEC-C motif